MRQFLIETGKMTASSGYASTFPDSKGNCQLNIYLSYKYMGINYISLELNPLSQIISIIFFRKAYFFIKD